MIPALEGRISGIAMRVPTSSVSVVDLVAEMERSVSVEELNAALRAAAEGPMRGVLYYEERPLVSTDFIRHPGSSIVDAAVTTVVDGTLAKSLAWYDNEWGYACRIGDICAMFAERGIE
jgi:glyceraldehyde 3-phosphate dehydrogenase